MSLQTNRRKTAMAQTAPSPISLAPDPGPAQPIIEIKGVSKEYHVNQNRTLVFDNFSYAVAKGSFLSIIGPSGCGKSTLLKLVSGLEKPSSGEIIFDSRIVDGPPRGMVYVFQQYAKSILPWLTVIENVEFGLRSVAPNMGRREARARCMEYIQLVGLDGNEDHYPIQLSGGMQQRVVIARALICEPAVLLMDEPFSAVDAMTRAILQELLLKIWESIPITILFVTHDVDEAVFLSNHIISLGRAPATIKADECIGLPYPRDQIKTRDDARFTSIRLRLFASIFAQEKAIELGST
jgi:NitT/TauT family transport system ATP-binding protein